MKAYPIQLLGMLLGGSGMGKKRRSFSIDEDVYEQLADRELNGSAVVNRFLREYFVGGDAGSVALQMRLQDIEREIEHTRSEQERLSARLDRLQREREQVEEQIDGKRNKVQNVVEEARATIGERTDPDNPAVQNWARKAGMDPREFVEALQHAA